MKRKSTKRPTKRKEKRNKKENNSKIIKLLTVAPELVTWDCSLTHVLQASSTQY